MSFKLASPTYVKYVHATGDSWDGQETLAASDGYKPVSYEDETGFDDLTSGFCKYASNKYWYNVKIYVGNTTDIIDATDCGYAGAETEITMANIVD